MFDYIVQRVGLDWRIPLYRKWFAYAQICSNYLDIIRHQRTGSDLDYLQLRGVGPVHFSDADQALQILDEIWVERVYTRQFRGPSPKVIVDIGANIGLFTLLASKIWPESRIHAYEPFPGNYQLLEENTRSAQLAMIQTYPQAVASQHETLPFFVKAQSGWHSLYATESEEIVQRIEVPAVSLSEVILSAGGWIDFMKIDCEGGEWSLLVDAPQSLTDAVGYLAMEYHEIDGHTHGKLIQVLQHRGFSVEAIPPDGWGTGLIYARSLNAYRPD